MKSILIFGGSGFIGRHLVEKLKEDFKITILSRNAPGAGRNQHKNVDFKQYSHKDPFTLIQLFDQANVVINLAGQNIGKKRWSKRFRDQIMSSRLVLGDLIKTAFKNCNNKPSLFIQASATHYYGVNPSDAEITENRPSTRDSFLTNVALEAEENVKCLENQTRLVFMRTGIVLDKFEGALSKMALPVKLFVGGQLGTGKQWVPWIHISDEVNAIKFIIENESLDGGINLTAPCPVHQKDFAKAIGKQLNRPSFLPTPAFMLRFLLGKMRANDLLLSGLNVVPKKLTDSGYKFQYKTISEALNDIYLKL